MPITIYPTTLKYKNSQGTYQSATALKGDSGRANIVQVSGTTPSIVAEDNTRYICGEVSTLSITLPASGIVDVVFESGSTATVLTVIPPTGITMKWANEFDPDNLEPNATYRLQFSNGEYAAATKWGGREDDAFELIETITLTEDTNDIERTQTPQGQSYRFKDMLLLISVPAYSKTVDARIVFSGTYGALFQLTLWSNTINTAARKSFISIERIGENLFKVLKNSGQQWNYSNGTVDICENTLADMQDDTILRFAYGANNSTNAVPAGTVIKVYAKWA